ncbi:hypothetical protein Hanom_Chr10g00900011 [Helianthus anomalus]
MAFDFYFNTIFFCVYIYDVFLSFRFEKLFKTVYAGNREINHMTSTLRLFPHQTLTHPQKPCSLAWRSHQPKTQHSISHQIQQSHSRSLEDFPFDHEGDPEKVEHLGYL